MRPRILGWSAGSKPVSCGGLRPTRGQVALALLALGLTAAAQAIVFAASGSVALLADLIHSAGGAATALPLRIAFALRSARRAPRRASSQSSSLITLGFTKGR